MAMVVALGFVLGACTSMKPVSDWQSLQEGDKVRVTTAPDGARITMKVIEVTPEGIQGKTRTNPESTTIPTDQIQEVEQKKVSALKTTGLVAGTAVAVLGLLVLGVALTW